MFAEGRIYFASEEGKISVIRAGRGGQLTAQRSDFEIGGQHVGDLQHSLLYLHRRLPDVAMLFSVAGPDAVHQLKSDSALQGAIGGVSAFQGLVDANLVTWVHAHRLVILAWTVNDSERFNQLVRLGVDGITTGNLAILRALSR